MKYYVYIFSRVIFLALTIFGISKASKWLFLYGGYQGWTLLTYYFFELIIFIRGKPAIKYGKKTLDFIVPILAISSILLLQEKGQKFISPNFSCLLFALGYLILFLGLISLGKNFDIIPAFKSLVTRGLYKYVRHPMYLGYMVLNANYLLNTFSLINLTIFLILSILLVIRIQLEEHFLSRVTDYKKYSEKVKYRLIPFIY